TLRLVERGTTHGFNYGVKRHAVCKKAVDLFVVRAVRQASVCLRKNLSEFGPLLLLARARVIIIIIRRRRVRSEEHTSELQSREKLVCRLLLEKKKKWLEIT